MMKKVFFSIFILSLIAFSFYFTAKNRDQVRSSLVSASGRLVEGNPDFPVIPGAEIDKSYKKQDLNNTSYEAIYEIDILPREAMNWYHDELLRAGWTIYDESIEDIITDLYIRASRDTEQINVFGEIDEGKTEIAIEYSTR